MKKIKLLCALLGLFSIAHAQNKGDTTKPKPEPVKTEVVYVFQRTDTVKARIVVVEKNGSLGIVRGFVFMTGMKNTQGQWLQQPTLYYMDAGYMPVRQEVLTAF